MGYSIKLGMLIHLLIAEGFMKGTQVQTFEEITVIYMNILI